MSENIIWGFGLFVGGLLLFIIEVLIPTGGIIGVAAALVAIAGVVAFWMESTTWGLASTLALIVLIPVAFQFAIKVMPHTPFGRMLILGSEEDEEQQEFERVKAEAEEHQRVQEMLGTKGVAKTDLRPVGSASFGGGEYVEVISELGVIEAGADVVITHVEGATIKVRRA